MVVVSYYCLNVFFQIWGVDVVSGNAVNWLECITKGHEVTLKPIARDNESLVSTVLLHLPEKKVNLYKSIAQIKTFFQ